MSRVRHQGIRSIALGWLALAAAVTFVGSARALPNTHAPAISTWDPRASSLVFGLGRSLTGTGSLSYTGFHANFSSTNGVLSAQFGLSYMTFDNGAGAPIARGVSAGGVALISLPLSERFANGVPRTAFAFYLGGVPTGLISGELNFISVPLVLGVGLPYSPSPYITLTPWAELSPGLNFDTRIEPISTQEAIASAMDGTLTRDEVEDLVEQGLVIEKKTTVGKRAGLTVAAHLGERVDFDVNLLLGAGRGSALALGAGLVVRWDSMVGDLARARPEPEPEPEDCRALAARYHERCPLRRRPAPPPGGAALAPTDAPVPAAGAAQHRAPSRPGAARATEQRGAPAPAPSAPPTGPSTSPTPAPSGSATSTTTKKPAPAAPAPPAPAPPAARPAPNELPPLQAAPPRTP